MSEGKNSIPSRKANVHVPPGSPREDDDVIVPTASARPAPAPFKPVMNKKEMNLAGTYRVREGYKVAYGTREGDDQHSVGKHAVAGPGEIVELSHEDALQVIRNTKDQRHPETGRPHGPAIETEAAYNARVHAEEEHKRFMDAINGESSPLNS